MASIEQFGNQHDRRQRDASQEATFAHNRRAMSGESAMTCDENRITNFKAQAAVYSPSTLCSPSSPLDRASFQVQIRFLLSSLTVAAALATATCFKEDGRDL